MLGLEFFHRIGIHSDFTLNTSQSYFYLFIHPLGYPFVFSFQVQLDCPALIAIAKDHGKLITTAAWSPDFST